MITPNCRRRGTVGSGRNKEWDMVGAAGTAVKSTREKEWQKITERMQTLSRAKVASS